MLGKGRSIQEECYSAYKLAFKNMSIENVNGMSRAMITEITVCFNSHNFSNLRKTLLMCF